MNDRQLHSFIKTVECGSFSKAEDVLYLSKQALKKQVDSLEEEVGFELLVRTRQGIELTEAGEEFFRGAKRILAEISAVTQRCKEIAFNDQVIRIDNPYHPRLMLEKAFDEFSRRFPTVRQHILLQESDHLVDDILNDYADVAECIYHEKYDQVPGVACTKLFETPYKCLMSSSNPLAARHTVKIEDLSHRSIYMLRNNASLISELREKSIDTNIVFLERNNTQEIINACYNNGIFISKAYYINSMQPLVAVPLETEEIPVAAILHREDPPQIVQEFIKVIQGLYPQEEAAGE